MNNDPSSNPGPAQTDPALSASPQIPAGLYTVPHHSTLEPNPAVPDDFLSDVTGTDMDFFGDVPLWTPEINRTCQKVANWIRCDYGGGFVFGLQHIGKSSCAQYIRATIPAILGPRIAIFLWLTDDDAKKSPENCLADWIRHSGCEYYSQTRKQALKLTLYDWLSDRANALGASRIVIIVDDAHWMDNGFYSLLLSVWNELKGRKRRPFVLQIGQPELQRVKDTFSGTDALQIVNRFFGVKHEYLGINPLDLRDLFAEMEKSKDGGFSKHFLPHLAPRGFSLERIAAPMVEAVNTLALSQNIRGEVRLPMGRLRSSICTLLYRLRADTSIVGVDAKLVYDCFVECELPDVLRYYVTGPA
jgi:hypothetical protein